MATTTFQPYTGNGSNKTFNYSFPTFTVSEVVVEVDGVVVDNFTIPSYETTGTKTVTFDSSTGTVNTNVCESDGSPKNGLEVIVRRDTNVDAAKASYTAGSSLKAADLTNNNLQILRALQEEQNTPLTTPKIRDGQVTSAKIKDLTIVDADIAAAAEIETYKLKDGTSNQVLITQLDGTTVGWSSALNLPTTLQVNGQTDLNTTTNVSGDFTVFDSGTQKFKVTKANGNTDIEGTLDVNGVATFTGAIDANGGAAIKNIRIGETHDNVITTTTGSLTLQSSNGNTTINDELIVTSASATVNNSQIVTENNSTTLTNKTLTTPVINDMSGTAVVTSGTSTSDNKVYSSKRSDELYYRKGTADDIEESGVPWSGNDSTIATTAAIDARIVDIVDDVGGFVPLVDEGEIPQLHPEYINKDTSDRVGTILSIGTLTTTYTPNGGTVTIQASDLTNHSVNATITDCGSTVLSAGFGVLVETKAQTDSQYAAGPSFKFHRLVPKATEVTTVAGKATEVTTVHTNINSVNTVATNISDINAVAADATDIGAGAAKATEIGRLGTADAVADMAILGTADVVADLNTLGTADVVSDLNTLATADVVADMNMLAVSDVISDMNDLATSGNITAMSNCSGSITNINTVASNIGTVNDFAARYDSGANNPTTNLDTGDLFFNTTSSSLKVYTGSAWVDGVTTTGNFALKTGNTFTGSNVHNDNVKSLYGTGSDLEIFHHATDGSQILSSTVGLEIKDTGGFMRIRSNELKIQSTANETYIEADANNAVQLLYDNVVKLETTTTGATVTGNLDVSSGVDVTGQITSTGALTITNESPAINLVDSGHNPDWEIVNSDGTFIIKDATNNASRIYIDSTGTVDVTGNLDVGAGLDVTGDISVSGSVDGVDIAAFKTSFDNLSSDKINEGNSKVEVVDAGTGYVTTEVDGTEEIRTIPGQTTVKALRVGESWTMADNTGVGLFLQTSNLNDVITSTANNGFQIEGTSIALTQPSSPNNNYATFNNNGCDLRVANVQKLIVNSSGTAITGNLDVSAGIDVTGAITVTGAVDNVDIAARNTLFGGLTSSSGVLTNGVTATTQSANDNSTKVATTAYVDAVTVGGASGIDFNDGIPVRFGSDNDLHIEHSGHHAYVINATGDLDVSTTSNMLLKVQGGELGIKIIGNGGTELYTDGIRHFTTDTGGVNIIDGDTSVYAKMTTSAGDAGYLYGESNSGIALLTSNGDYGIRSLQDGATELYWDAAKKLETTSTGVQVYDNLYVGDNDNDVATVQVTYSTVPTYLTSSFDGTFGEATLSVNASRTSDGSGSWGSAGNGGYGIGALQVLSHPSTGSQVVFLTSNADNTAPSKRVMVTGEGHLIPYLNNTYDLGTTSTRWRNVYTNDLHLSNEGHSNDVDGSWGNWTIQEGESDLFLKNNRSGKTYKFNLTEVS